MNNQLHTKNLLVKTIKKACDNVKIDTVRDSKDCLHLIVDNGYLRTNWFTIPPFVKGENQRFYYDGLYGGEILNQECVGSGDFIDALSEVVYEAGYNWEIIDCCESVICKN